MGLSWVAGSVVGDRWIGRVDHLPEERRVCAMSVGNTMDTLSKLLNQAENAATQAEADAFFERAQEWASRHAITLEQARAHTADSQRREEPTHEQVVIGAPRQHVNGHLCLLASAIGHEVTAGRVPPIPRAGLSRALEASWRAVEAADREANDPR